MTTAVHSDNKNGRNIDLLEGGSDSESSWQSQDSLGKLGGGGPENIDRCFRSDIPFYLG